VRGGEQAGSRENTVLEDIGEGKDHLWKEEPQEKNLGHLFPANHPGQGEWQKDLTKSRK